VRLSNIPDLIPITVTIGYKSQLVSAELSLCSVSLAISRQCWATLAKSFFAVGFFAAAELRSASSDFVR
jgi:hypothetical protein